MLARGRFDQVRLEGFARDEGGVVEDYQGIRLITHDNFGVAFVEPGLVALGVPAAVRKAIAATKNFDGINGKWSFDENGDVDYDTMSGFKVVKADTPIGCKFQFESILE